MKDKLLSYCKKESLFSPGDRVICALSGGSDSMALLHCLHSLEKDLEITVEAAHFNHRLRGEESDADEAFVSEFCQIHQIPLHLGGEDVYEYSRRNHLGIEEGARQCRYSFFQTLSGKIATAHNADDNLETVLMHLIRGSGLRGLCGIPPTRERIVRPLLWATKAEILSYLEQEQIPYREDSSNRSLAYTRNRIRHQVLPLLRGENPDLAQGVLQQSHILRQEDLFLDALAKNLLKKDATGAYSLIPLLSAPEPLQNRALRLMVREYLEQDVSFVHIDALRSLLYHPCPSAQIQLPHGLIACRRYDHLCFRWELPSPFAVTALAIPGETVLPGSPWKICCEIQKKFTKMTNTPFLFAIKCDMIEDVICAPQLFLRPRQIGDRMQMADGHSKSLKKLMIDNKIPKQDRDLLPVFTDGTHVLAVGGLGASPHFVPSEGDPALIITILTT